MMKSALLLCILLAATIHQPIIALDSASDLDWLAGTWTCDKWGGTMTEVWSAATGNSLIGMFSHVKDGQPAFYEFMAIEKNADGLRFYLRHFNPKSVAREDKGTPLVFSVKLVGRNEAVFERIDAPDSGTKLIYKLEAPDKLTARLEKTKDGKTQIEVFNYTRSKRTQGN